MVDLILHDEYFGYHEENWKVKSASGVSGGKSSGSVMAEGIGGVMVVDKSWRRARQIFRAVGLGHVDRNLGPGSTPKSRQVGRRASRMHCHGRRNRAGGLSDRSLRKSPEERRFHS